MSSTEQNVVKLITEHFDTENEKTRIELAAEVRDLAAVNFVKRTSEEIGNEVDSGTQTMPTERSNQIHQEELRSAAEQLGYLHIFDDLFPD